MPDEAARALSSVAGVRSVSPLRPAADERVEVELDVEPGVDASEAVYDWAVAHGCKILGMRTEKASLEELFAKLTSGGKE